MATDPFGSFTSACDAYLVKQHALLARLASTGALSAAAAIGLQARLDQIDAAMRRTQRELRAGADDAARQPDDFMRNDTKPRQSSNISNR
jgi:hypothetical protein